MRRIAPFLILIIGLAACSAALAQGPTYGRGKPVTLEEIKSWDLAVGPEGKELPPGSGTAKQGAAVFAKRCAACHGTDGKYQWPRRAHPPSGGLAPVLAGEKGVIVAREFATTIWDYINRAMPLGQEAGTLTHDEVYAVTAYLLYLDGIVKENEVMDAKSLPSVRMPHRPPGYK